MSNDFFKIIRSIKGYSNHGRHHDNHGHFSNDHSRYSGYHHDDRHGKYSGSALAVAEGICGKLLQHKRLAVIVIIGVLVLAAILVVSLVWLFFIFCAPLISEIEKTGLKDSVLRAATTIWEGSGT